MVNSIPTCLALTPWTPVSHQNSLPVKYYITIEAPEMSIMDQALGQSKYRNQSIQSIPQYGINLIPPFSNSS
jgi:hypothetical protein